MTIQAKLPKPDLSNHLIGPDNVDDFIRSITKKAVEPELLVIDLFCGAGGTSTGFEMTDGRALVIACVNHDKNAIKSHWANYKYVAHFQEDIRTLDLTCLVKLVNFYRAMYPNARIVLHASLECTNFSKAKGSQPRDADSRTLAEHLERYIQYLNPDYITIENVVEFMSWGPLDENGKPVSKRNGIDYMRWCNMVNSYGYRDEWKELNSANFGAYTSRNRLFGIFAKDGLPISWPSATHGKVKKAKTGLQGSFFDMHELKPWKAVKEVLDFTDEGKSIFERAKPLSDKTLERIYAGLIKFVAGGKDKFMAQTYATASNSDGTYTCDGPARTVTTRDSQQIVQPVFLSTYNGGNAEFRNKDINEPCKTLTTRNSHTLVNVAFIQKHFSGHPEGKVTSIEEPAGTLTTVCNQSMVYIVQRNGGNPDGKVVDVNGPARTLTGTGGNQDVTFISVYHGNGANVHSVDGPAPTIPTKDSQALVMLVSHYGNGSTLDTDQPLGTIMTKDKVSIV